MKNRALLPPLHTLRAFEAIARLRSFTLAAVELHLTHSAISHQMRALESSLQTTLIDRKRRDVALTPEGHQFLAVVRPVLQQLWEVTDALRQADSRRLRINVLPSFAARWLLPRLGDFFIRHPDIDFEIATTPVVVDLVVAGAHLAIRYGDGHWTKLRSELLFAERLFPVASPDYMREHGIGEANDLAGGTLLRDDFYPWDDWLSAASLNPARLSFGPVYYDSALVLQAAENGQGVALGRSWLVADALRTGTLCQIGSVSVPAAASYFLVWPRDKSETIEVKEFIAWIRTCGEDAGAAKQVAIMSAANVGMPV